MPKHLAMGTTYKTGTVEFDDRKAVKIFFDVPFSQHPSINLTLEDNGSTYTPYRTKVKKGSFRVVFKNKYTGTIGWEASGE